jgi:hypothetical protein
MQNIDNVNTASLKAIEAGTPYFIFIIRCLKTGGRFISVRSVSPYAFETGLKACAKDRNFGAYNSPILESFRKYGEEGHSILLHSAYKTRIEANKAKKALVEKQAMSKPETNLNWNRPIKRMPNSVFRWLSEEEMAEKAKAKRAKARAAKTTVTETANTEAAA